MQTLCMIAWALAASVAPAATPSGAEISESDVKAVSGMTREELDQVMEPKLYIGRCEQQVLRFLDECAPLLRAAAAEDGAIDL